MYATVHPAPLAEASAAGAIEVAHLDGAGSTAIAFWPDRAAAPAGERVYELVDRLDGPASGRAPLFAQVTWINSAGDPSVADAADRAGRERLSPVIRDVDGLVGVLVFRSADHRLLVVGLATGMETYPEVAERIMGTELLPGEDPALLPGPDRLELGRVVRADVPQAVRS